MSDALLDVKAAAQRLNIGERTLWRLINAGQIGHVRIGRSIRLTCDDVDTFIEANHKAGKRRVRSAA